MAGSADPGPNQEIDRKSPEYLAKRQALRETVARLYGQGIPRKDIAKLLIDHLVPNQVFDDGTPRPLEQRLSQARAKLREWERQPSFRDLVYKLAVVKLDLATPQILDGVAKKAKRGRVDAARLALEITGRHNPKGDSQPAQVVIAFGGIPRPNERLALKRENDTVTLEGADAVVEETDDV